MVSLLPICDHFFCPRLPENFPFDTYWATGFGLKMPLIFDRDNGFLAEWALLMKDRFARTLL
jgi:hypothetical protein